MPRAGDLPSFQLGLTETRCPSNPLGMKGLRRSGGHRGPSAVINALVDGARDRGHFHARHTPAKVWSIAQARMTRRAAENEGEHSHVCL